MVKLQTSVENKYETYGKFSDETTAIAIIFFCHLQDIVWKFTHWNITSYWNWKKEKIISFVKFINVILQQHNNLQRCVAMQYIPCQNISKEGAFVIFHQLVKKSHAERENKIIFTY